MYNGIGLRTVRGSGTNGFVAKNRAHVSGKLARKRQQTVRNESDRVKRPRDRLLDERMRRGDPKIAAHERKRKVELKVFELQAEMEDQGYPEDEIDKRTAALRERLTRELDSAMAAPAGPRAGPGPFGGIGIGIGGSGGGSGSGSGSGSVGPGAAHSQAYQEAHAARNRRLAAAFGVRPEQRPGDSFDNELQQKLMHERREAREIEKKEVAEARAKEQEQRRIEQEQRRVEQERRSCDDGAGAAAAACPAGPG
eukprot:g559.t1